MQPITGSRQFKNLMQLEHVNNADRRCKTGRMPYPSRRRGREMEKEGKRESEEKLTGREGREREGRDEKRGKKRGGYKGTLSLNTFTNRN